MSDEPTIKDVLEALKATETRLESRITQQIRDTEKRLSNEIAGDYSLHDERFSDLEKRISAIEQRLAH